MTKEMYINAMQNTGAVLFIIGLVGCLTIDSVLALIISWGLMFIGSTVIFIGEHIVDKQKQEQKIKVP